VVGGLVLGEMLLLAYVTLRSRFRNTKA